MEVRILEVRLAGGTKAVWRFSGEAACCCLELIEKVVIPEMLPGMLPVAAQVRAMLPQFCGISGSTSTIWSMEHPTFFRKSAYYTS